LLRDRPTELQPELQEFDPSIPDPTPQAPSPPLQPVRDLPKYNPDRASVAVGQPWKGRLRNGVQLPREGAGYFTFDSALRISPSRGWRRWGTASTVSRTQAVLADFAAAHPEAPRLGIGDLSRPRGGTFDRRYGGLGHASHQNGQDVDVYYPRRDRREVPPSRPSEVNRRLSQDLVNRFVAAGAQMVFVGPRVRLRGPRGVVMKLVNHDDHLHVRWPAR
jgi:murein endopeptidase